MSSDLIPAAMIVVVGATEAAQLVSGHGLTLRPLVAGFVLGLGLLGISAIDEGLARAFAILVIVVALLNAGEKGLFGKLLGASK